MNVPGARVLEANNPFCVFAGWEGLVMGVIFMRGEGPLVWEEGRIGVIVVDDEVVVVVELGEVRRCVRSVWVSDLLWVEVVRYGTFGGQFLGRGCGGILML